MSTPIRLAVTLAAAFGLLCVAGCGDPADAPAPADSGAASQPASGSSDEGGEDAFAVPADHQWWGSFGVGSSATMTGTATMKRGADVATSSETRVRTLEAIRDGKAVVNVASSDADGAALERTEELPLDVVLSAKELLGLTASETGSQALTVPAGTFDCTWHAAEKQIGSHSMRLKWWTSPRVPGGLVKLESALGDSNTKTMELSSFDAK
jgi:hypothetical protein